MDAKGFLKEITSSQDYRGQICGEQSSRRPPRYGQLTGALAETLAASLRKQGSGLYSTRPPRWIWSARARISWW